LLLPQPTTESEKLIEKKRREYGPVRDKLSKPFDDESADAEWQRAGFNWARNED
jgi:hypothetical protein